MRRAFTFKYSLYFTFGMSTILCVILAVGLQSMFIYFPTKSQTEKELKKTAEQTILKIERTISELVASYAQNEYENIVLREMVNEDILAIVVEDSNMAAITGRKHFLSGKIRNGKWNVVDFDSTSTEHKELLDAGFYTVEQPLSKQGEKIGSVTIYISDRFLNVALSKVVMQTIIQAVVVSLFLIITLLLIMKFVVIDPLKFISYFILQTDNNGIPGETIPPSGSPEIMLLSNTMNIMIDSIRSSREGLEDLVQERTAELEKEKENAESANRAKSIFLANMSHEIRTPMNAVLGFTEILKTKENDPKKLHYIENIYSSGKALLSLINDILDLSKVEAGKLELQYGVVSLKQLFASMEDIFQQKMAEHDLDFRIDISDSIPESLLLDEVRLCQVLINLIANAVKFTGSGYVRLTATMDQSETKPHGCVNLTIAVEDTGIGISADKCLEIFKPFEQVKDQNEHFYGGTGLGLTISRRLIELMNGTISVDSETGYGSTFTVKLTDIEIAEAQPHHEQERPLDLTGITFDTATILVVDDISYNRELLSIELAQWGFQLIEAENGKDAIEQARTHRPDLILMDMRMPVMDGYQATQILKSDNEMKNIPVIAITASALAHEVEALREMCDGYICKPISQHCLIAELLKYLPHTVSEESAVDLPEEQEIQDEPVPGILSPEKADEIRKLLSGELYQAWEQCSQRFIFSEIASFAEKIKSWLNSIIINHWLSGPMNSSCRQSCSLLRPSRPCCSSIRSLLVILITIRSQTAAIQNKGLLNTS